MIFGTAWPFTGIKEFFDYYALKEISTGVHRLALSHTNN